MKNFSFEIFELFRSAKNVDEMNFEKMAVKIRVKIEFFLYAKILLSKTGKTGVRSKDGRWLFTAHAEFGPNDHRIEAHPFIFWGKIVNFG